MKAPEESMTADSEAMLAGPVVLATAHDFPEEEKCHMSDR